MVRGIVTASDGRGALAGASVTVRAASGGQRLGAVSDEGGRFIIRGVPSGPAALGVRLLGYRPVDTTLTVQPDDTLIVAIQLAVTAIVLDEVRVRARRTDRERFDRDVEVGTIAISSTVLSDVPPVGEADVLRTVQLQPGVSTRNDFNAGYHVRGGEADQNLVVLDGIPIYNPFHLGGLFGTFIERAVGGFELHSAAFPAAYGGRLSSVLDVASRVPERTGVHGQIATSLLASSAVVGGVLPARGTEWIVAARRTYADKLAEGVARRYLPYHFWDGQLHARQALPRGMSVALTAYAGRDVLDGNFARIADTADAAAGEYYLDWGNLAAGATVLVPLGDRTSYRQRVSVSRFSTTLDLGDGARLTKNALTDVTVAGALSRAAGAHQLRGGYEWSTYTVRFDVTAPQTTFTEQRVRQSPSAAALWVEDAWRVNERWLARPGVRLEHVPDADYTGVSPRLGVKYFVTPDVAMLGAVAHHAQWMHSLRPEDTPIRFFDYWLGSDGAIPVSTARHAVVGIEGWRGAARMARVQLYWKGYDGLVEPDPAQDPARPGDEFRAMDGHSYGVDVLVRQLETQRFSGWLAYTYTVASRTVGDTSFFAALDRRHGIDLVTTWRGVRAPFVLSARLGFGSGTPYTPVIGQVVRRQPSAAGGWDEGSDRQMDPVAGPRNSERLPLYHRLDLGASRTIQWYERTVTLSASLTNAYARDNVLAYTYDFQSRPATRTAIGQFPLLPSVGLAVEF